MARKRRRKSQAQPPSPPPEREERFHAPFQDLKASLRQANAPPATPAPPASAPALPDAAQLKVQQAAKARQAAARREAAQRQKREEEQDQAAFRAAMSDVQRLPPDPRGRVAQPHRVGSISGLPSDDEVSLNELRDLVQGRSVFTLQFTDEYMEGVAQDVDQRLAQRLHRGDFAIQAQLDLHGYFVEDAKQQVDQFLTLAYTTGQRCIRLIHGRGRNSPDNRPVLKEHVQLWLSQGRLSRMVLAFATAPAHDGGAGVTYVLLRRSTIKRHR
jgi:DNA-nicking Smr family endonuclease